MGLSKHVLTKSKRARVVESIDSRLPDGSLRRNFANTISLGGAALVTLGARVDGKAGLVLRAVGELADDVDGDAARALGITSEFGAKLDAVLDKWKLYKEFQTLWDHTEDFQPEEQLKRRTALAIIAGKHSINAALNTTAEIMGLEPKTSRAGAANLWVDGIALAAFGLSDVTQNPVLSQRFAEVGYAFTGAGVLTGATAIVGYSRQFNSQSPIVE